VTLPTAELEWPDGAESLFREPPACLPWSWPSFRVLCIESTRSLLGCLRCRASSCFHPSTRLARPDRPSLLSKRVHPLVPCFSFEVPSSDLPAPPFGFACPARLLVPSWRLLGGVYVSNSVSRCRGSSSEHLPDSRRFGCESTPASATFRPQAFSASRRLAPLPSLRACCIPLPPSGFVPFRGFSRLTAWADSSPARAPLPFGPFGSPSSTALPRENCFGRLPPPGLSTSRLYSVNRCVLRSQGLADPSVAPLFGFRPLPGLRALVVSPLSCRAAHQL